MNKICFWSIIGGLIAVSAATCFVLAKRCKKAETLADLLVDNDIEYARLFEEGENE